MKRGSGALVRLGLGFLCAGNMEKALMMIRRIALAGFLDSFLWDGVGREFL